MCSLRALSLPDDILGERTSVVNQQKVWDKIKDTNISLSLAAVANWGYEFRKEPAKVGANPMISPRTAHIFSHGLMDWVTLHAC
jgi:hypothetical protein